MARAATPPKGKAAGSSPGQRNSAQGKSQEKAKAKNQTKARAKSSAKPQTKTTSASKKRAAAPPLRRIVLCLDGTWNEPEQLAKDGQKNEATNVLKMVRAVLPRAEDGADQIVYYDTGVGTQGPLDKIFGGGFGQGISLNIMQAYRFLANNYAEGDEIFLFGFSRGAYTARALAGFIGAAGLLSKQHLAYVPEAYQYYRTPIKLRPLSQHLTLLDSLPEGRRKDVPIKFIGVWDTVGALGAPTPLLRRFTAKSVGFHDTGLGKSIQNAYHALAIDERRGPFSPDLWTEAQGTDQTVEQVWFAGVHSNIGGSYSNTVLSDITLAWMCERAARHGLALDPRTKNNNTLPAEKGRIEKSYGFMYSVLHGLGAKKYNREIGPKQFGSTQKPKAGLNESVHRSALDAVGVSFDHIKGKDNRVWLPQKLKAALEEGLPVTD
ncbi:DUF2235 domain-containing protein [Rhodovibrionaceae bacterium A322]